MRHQGLFVGIYRAADGIDCSIGGVTTRFNTLIAVGCGLPEIFTSLEDSANVVQIIYREQFDDYIARPISPAGRALTGGMFGGNFIYTSDSRFSQAMGGRGHPIPVHDRFEGAPTKGSAGFIMLPLLTVLACTAWGVLLGWNLHAATAPAPSSIDVVSLAPSTIEH